MARWGTVLWLAGGLWVGLPVAGVEGRSIVRIGGDVVVEKEMRVGAAVAVGGNVTVRGVVEEDAVAVAGSVLLGPEAVVHGNVVSVAGTIRQEEGAQIRGDIVEVSVPGISSFVGSLPTEMWRGWVWAFSVVTFVGLLALALLLVALAPKPFDRISTMVETHVLTAAVWGLLGLVLTVPLAIFLGISVVGIPLIPVEVILVGCGLLVGYIAVAQLIGRKMAAAMRRPDPGILWEVSGGLITLWVIGWTPVLGWLAKAVIALLGFGGVIATLLAAAKSHR